MATYPQAPGPESRKTNTNQEGNLVGDLRSEIAHEARGIRGDGSPVDPSHTDKPVRRHAFGLSIGFFVAIIVFLILVIGGIMLFGGHH